MIEQELRGYGACLFCVGVSAVGMSEHDYRRVTYDFTLKVAQTLERLNPKMTFVYVSGGGTDSTERGVIMWARVKGATENALLSMPFERAYMLRPGFIRPLHGVVSKTGWYRALHAVVGPVYPRSSGVSRPSHYDRRAGARHAAAAEARLRRARARESRHRGAGGLRTRHCRLVQRRVPKLLLSHLRCASCRP